MMVPCTCPPGQSVQSLISCPSHVSVCSCVLILNCFICAFRFIHSFVDIYRDLIIPNATVLTPNQTEAGLLSGRDITSVDDAVRACHHFHAQGIHTVVITSVQLPDDPQHIHIVASSMDMSHSTELESKIEESGFVKRVCLSGEDNQSLPYLHARVPRFDRYVSGTGDLTAALLLAWGHSQPLHVTLSNTFATVHSIVEQTHQV